MSFYTYVTVRGVLVCMCVHLGEEGGGEGGRELRARVRVGIDMWDVHSVLWSPW